MGVERAADPSPVNDSAADDFITKTLGTKTTYKHRAT